MTLRFALWKVVHIIVLRGCSDEPLWLHVRHCPDVVLGGEDELVVENPLGFVIQTGGRMQLDYLVVFDGQVVAGALQVGDLKVQKRKFQFQIFFCLTVVDYLLVVQF